MSKSEARNRFGDNFDNLAYDFYRKYKELAENEYDVVPINMQRELDPEEYKKAMQGSPFGESKFRYKGVIALPTLFESADYYLGAKWRDVVRAQEGQPVLQVFRGKEIGETYDMDGRVIMSEETIAVFDLSLIESTFY